MKQRNYLTEILAINFSILFLFCADRLLKYFVLYKLPGKGVYFISAPWSVGLRLVQNKFIAFSIPMPVEITIVFSLIILAFFFFFLFKTYQKRKTVLIIILTLIITGALSNLIDRILYGYVIDYINIFSLSFFNIADIMIVGGVILFIIRYYEYQKK